MDQTQQPATVRITPGAGAHGVALDGQDLTEVLRRATVDLQPGQLPQVYLELKQGVGVEAIETSAVVHVTREVHEDAADAMARFLDQLDPAELDKAVLESMEMGGPATYGAAAIEVMRRWARGD